MKASRADSKRCFLDHRIRSSRSRRVCPAIPPLIGVTIFALAGCALYPDAPNKAWMDKELNSQSPSPPPHPTESFELAIRYAEVSRDNYRQWLIGEQNKSLYVGGGALALGGAALGLATSGGSTAAVTALGVAGGAGIAADQWLLGTPKDAKHKAYTSAINQLQCVIGDAWGETPRPSRTSSPALASMQSVLGGDGLYADLVQANLELSTQMQGLLKTIDSLPSSCQTGTELRDARLTLAQATAVYHRATALGAVLARAPIGIVRTVDAIDTGAFTQSQDSAPDISKLPTITSLSPKAPAANGKPAQGANKSNLAFNALQESTDCGAGLRSGSIEAANAAQKVDQMISGVVAAQPGFAECLKPPAPPKGEGSDAPAKPAAVPPMAVLPGLHLVGAKKSSLDMTISGGHAPFDLIVVDPGIEFIAKPGGEANFSIKVTSAAIPGQTLRLLITDSAGAQALVSIQIVDAVASDN
jgi:hypothetical protein